MMTTPATHATVATSARHAVRLSSSTATLKEQAYAQIRHRIETQQLQRGVRISNRKLAQTLGMSAIPVREAVTQLAGEGLLEHRPGIGTFVVNPDRDEIAEIYELRELLESHSARRAASVIGSIHLDQMHQSIALMKRINERIGQCRNPDEADRLYEQWTMADASFHLAVLGRAGNRMAIKMVSGLRLMTRIFGHKVSRLRLQHLEVPLREHVAILEAIEQRDAIQAGRLMRKHIRGGRRIALRRDDMQRRLDMGGLLDRDGSLTKLEREITQLQERD
ncbi:MAG: GntR family transcriptional regulator [Phycisphaeraceae bacterium]|nr:GntR family transcriptional regulator [Phycisphaeraceae bacterium]